MSLCTYSICSSSHPSIHYIQFPHSSIYPSILPIPSNSIRSIHQSIHPPNLIIHTQPVIHLPAHLLFMSKKIAITRSAHPILVCPLKYPGLPPHPSIHPSIQSFFHPSICPSHPVCPLKHLSIHPSIHLPHPSINIAYPIQLTTTHPSVYSSTHPNHPHPASHPSASPSLFMTKHEKGLGRAKKKLSLDLPIPSWFAPSNILVCLLIHPSIHPIIHPSIHLPIPSSLPPQTPIHPSIHPSLHLFIIFWYC